MDRRNFLRAAFAIAGAATVGTLASSAEAASLIEGPDAGSIGDLPAEGAAEAQFYERRDRGYDDGGRRGFGGDRPRFDDDWRRRRRWRRSPRCVVTRNRWGEMVRRCERF